MSHALHLHRADSAPSPGWWDRRRGGTVKSSARGNWIRGLVAAAAASLLGLAVATSAGAAAHAATGTSTSGSGCPTHVNGRPKVNHFGGIVHPQSHDPACRVRPAGDPAIGTPPLLFHGGPVMGTASTGPVVVTPIYWAPPGHPIDNNYRNIINAYLGDVAAASGQHTNVYATLTEYYGTNGAIRYLIRRGDPDRRHRPAARERLQAQRQGQGAHLRRRLRLRRVPGRRPGHRRDRSRHGGPGACPATTATST